MFDCIKLVIGCTQLSFCCIIEFCIETCKIGFNLSLIHVVAHFKGVHLVIKIVKKILFFKFLE